MLLEEGLDNVFGPSRPHAEATRRAVHAWGLECNAPIRALLLVVDRVRLPEGTAPTPCAPPSSKNTT